MFSVEERKREPFLSEGITLLCFLVIFFIQTTCMASEILVYLTDFSSNPNWVTDDPAKLYWDQLTQTYYGHQVNTEGTYSFVDIASFDPNKSWRLEYEVKVNDCGWSAGVNFGLYDSSIEEGKGSYVSTTLTVVDQGNIINIAAFGKGPYNNTLGWQVGVWYSCILEYDSSLNTMTATWKIKDTGVVFAVLSIVSDAPFSTDMRKIALTRKHMKDTKPGASGSAFADFNIGNVRLYQIDEIAENSLSKNMKLRPLASPCGWRKTSPRACPSSPCLRLIANACEPPIWPNALTRKSNAAQGRRALPQPRLSPAARLRRCR